jgi:hypothetical protein
MQFLWLREQADRPLPCQVHPPQAEIVAPPLYEDGRELFGDHAAQQRQVFLQELLLEANRVRGDDDAAAGLGFFRPKFGIVVVLSRAGFGSRDAGRIGGDVVDGRDEISKGFANARARFRHQVLAGCQRLLHGVGQGQLLRPVLIRRQAGRNAASGTEDSGGRKHGRRNSSQRSEVRSQRQENATYQVHRG